MKTLLIILAAAVTFASCRKCPDVEREWRCEITSYEYEGVSAPVTVTVPFIGTYNEKVQFEAARTVKNAQGEVIQECKCR